MALPAETFDTTLTDSMARRLRLRFAALTGEQRLTEKQLMEASCELIEQLARKASGAAAQIATGVTACPRDYLRWEAEHMHAMRLVAWQLRRPLQLRALLHTGMELTHRAALFGTLRSHALRGRERRHLVARLHSQQSYTQAIVAEHSNYRRSIASLACVEHLAATLFAEPRAAEALEDYARVYNDYFAAYCEIATHDRADEPREALLPELKSSVVAARHSLRHWGEKPAV